MPRNDVASDRPHGRKIDAFIQNFAPGWFVVSMGTGGLAVVLHQLPYQFPGLGIISDVFFGLNILIFSISAVLYTLRWIRHPRETAWKVMRDHYETPYITAIIVAFTTFIPMIALVCAPSWGHAWAIVAYVFWWITAVLGIIGSVLLTFTIIRYHTEHVDSLGLVNALTPVIMIIPMSPLTTAAISGTLTTYTDLSPRLTVPMLLFAFWLVGIGLLLNAMFYVLYLVRLMNRSVLPFERAPTSIIMIGPLGMGAFAFLNIGSAISKGHVFQQYARGTFLTAATEEAVFACCVVTAMVLQGFGIFWGGFAVVEMVESFVHHRQITGETTHGYSLSWWSIVFPIAVNCMALEMFSTIMTSPAFSVLSTIVVFILLITWFGNAICTLYGILTGQLLDLNGGWTRLKNPVEGINTQDYPVIHSNESRGSQQA